MRPDHTSIDRRSLVAGGLALAVAPGAYAAPRVDFAAAFAALEARVGGRLGVQVLDTGSGRRLAHRAGERFPMCSTFKWLAAAAVLARVDRGAERLDRRIAFTKADLLFTSPELTKRAGEGALPLGDLCAAAIAYSDNTAANLILSALDGPAGLTRWLRSAGDRTTRLDRNEPTLNTAVPGDPRDTTTPQAMVSDLERIVLGKTLSTASRDQLSDWMVGCKTGDARLRAGLPKGWRIGDKTGTGTHGTCDDVAVVWPPSRPPILIAAYLTQAEKASDDERNQTLAEVGRIAASQLGLGP